MYCREFLFDFPSSAVFTYALSVSGLDVLPRICCDLLCRISFWREWSLATLSPSQVLIIFDSRRSFNSLALREWSVGVIGRVLCLSLLQQVTSSLEHCIRERFLPTPQWWRSLALYKNKRREASSVVFVFCLLAICDELLCILVGKRICGSYPRGLKQLLCKNKNLGSRQSFLPGPQ